MAYRSFHQLGHSEVTDVCLGKYMVGRRSGCVTDFDVSCLLCSESLPVHVKHTMLDSLQSGTKLMQEPTKDSS